MTDWDCELSKFSDSRSKDNADNVHNIQDAVIDQAAEDGAGNQGPPDTIPSNI